MSRTYRKQIRYYTKFRGEIVNTCIDRTLKGKARQYRTLKRWSRKNTFTDEEITILRQGNDIYMEVLVGDSDCLGTSGTHGRSIKWYKRIANKRNRARCRQALYHHPDNVHFKDGFDWYEID